MFGGMTTAAQLMVKVGADVSEAERKLSGMSAKLQDIGGSAMKAGGMMTAGITLPLAAVAVKLGSYASDLNETSNKANVVFGDQAAAMQAWAATASETYGLSTQAALDYSSSLGNMVVQLGGSEKQAATFSQEMVGAASDLASFHNAAGGSAEVLEAMSGAFRGEYDALQRYIPTINAAAVEQQALAMTGKNSAKELTAMEKAMAAQAIIMRDMGPAAGDFARTSGDLANAQRTLKADIADVAANLGTQLLPMFAQIVSWVSQAVSWFGNLDPSMQAVILAVAGLAAAAGPLVTAVGAIGVVIGALLSPIGLVVAGIVALGAAIVNHFGGIGPTVEAAKTALQPLLDWLAENLPVAIQTLSDFWTNTLQPALAAVWVFIQESVIPALQTMGAWLAENLPVAIQALAEFWTGTLQPALAAVWAFIQGSVIPILQDVFTWLATNIPPAIQALANFWTGTLQPALASVWAFIQGSVIPILQDVFTWLATNIPPAIQTLSDFWTNTLLPAIEGVWNFISVYLVPLFTSLVDVTIAAVKLALAALGLAWDVLKAVLTKVWEFVRDNLVPIFEKIATKLDGPVTTALNAFKSLIEGGVTTALGIFQGAIDAVKGAIDGIVGAIDTVIGWIDRFREKLAGLTIPSWLTPGSPTPLELGLIGIGQAFDYAARMARVMTNSLSDITDLEVDQELVDYVAALGAVADGLGRVLSAMLALSGYGGVPNLESKLETLKTNIRTVIAEMKLLAEFFAQDDSGIWSAKAVLDPLAEIFDNLSRVVDALDQIGDLEISVAKITLFAQNLRVLLPALVNALVDAADQINLQGLPAAVLFAQAAGDVLGIMRDAVDGITAAMEFTAPEIDNTKVFIESLRRFVAQLQTMASEMGWKTFDAAIKFAEAAGKIGAALKNALGGLVAAMEFMAPEVDNTKVFFDTMRRFVAQLQTMASEMGWKTFDAAIKFAEAAGKIATAMAKGMDLLQALARYVGPTEDRMLAFLRDVQFLMERALRWVQLVIGPLVEDVGTDLFDVLTAMVESLGAALTLLEGLAEYVAVGETAILAFMDDLDDLVRLFVRWAIGSRSGPILLLDVPAELMAIFTAVMDGLASAVDVLTALVGYVSPGEAAIHAFMADLDALVRGFIYWVMSSRSGPILLLDVPAELMVIFSAVMDGLAAAVDVLTALVDYVSPGEDAIAAFTADYQRLFGDFVAWAEGALTDVALETVTAVATAVGAVFAGLGDAVGVLSGIVDYVGPSEAAIAAFTTDYRRLFGDFVAWANGALTDVTAEVVTAVGDAVGAVFAGLGDAAGVLASIVGYVGPSEAAIDSFTTDYQRLMSDFRQWAATTWTTESAALVQAVGDAARSVFEGVGAAAAALQSITWYVGPTENKLALFMADMQTLMTGLRDWALGAFTVESLAFLQEFGATAQTLFSAVGSALSVMEGIADYTVSGSTFDLALQRFNDNLYTMLQSWRIWIVTVMDPETLALVAAFAGVMGAIVTGFRDALNLLMDIENANLPTADQLQAFLDAMTLLFNHVIQNFGDVAAQIATLSGQMGSALATTLLIMSDHIALFAQQAAIEIDALFSGMGTQMWVQGRYVAEMFMNGLLNGMTNATAQNRLLDAMNALALALKDVLMAAWGIASPSKVAEGIGKNFVAGLANGLADLQGIPGMIEDAVGLTMNNNVRLEPAPQRAYLTVSFQGAYQAGMTADEEARISRAMVMELRRQGVALVTR